MIGCALPERGGLAATNPGGISRVSALDGLRGAAALVVVAFHVLDYVVLPRWLVSGWLMSPLGILVNGPGAVHLFFVLSGYVLALSSSLDSGLAAVPRFYVRRLFRIQPAFMFAVLFAWVTSLGFPIVGGLGRWMIASHAGQPCFHIPVELLPRAMLLPSMAYGQLPVGWSLHVELMMSAAFPILWQLGRRIHPVVALAVGIGTLSIGDPRFRVFNFAFDFALGLFLFMERDAIGRRLARLPRAAQVAWILAGIVLMQLPFVLTRAERGLAVLEQGHPTSTIVLMSLGSAMLIAGALYFPFFRRPLELPWARYCGRISYSLYLLHTPVLLFLVCRITGQRLPWPAGIVVFAMVLALSIGLSELAWRWIEEPSIRAGRWLNQYLGAKRATAG